MPIRVRFDKNGWYHPAYGRLGRGKFANTIYVLPDMFGEKETIKVPRMDHSSIPPKQVGEKEITRYKYLPSSVEIIDDETLKEAQDEAKLYGEDGPTVIKPVESELVEGGAEQIAGRGREPAKQGAIERTTGTAPKRRRVVRA